MNASVASDHFDISAHSPSVSGRRALRYELNMLGLRIQQTHVSLKLFSLSWIILSIALAIFAISGGLLHLGWSQNTWVAVALVMTAIPIVAVFARFVWEQELRRNARKIEERLNLAIR